MPDKASAHRNKVFNVRIDTELFDAVVAKADTGLGPLVRALLRAYARGDVEVKPEDLLRELKPAPKTKRKPRKPKK